MSSATRPLWDASLGDGPCPRGWGNHSRDPGRPSPVQRRDFLSWLPPGRDFLFSSWSSGSALDPGRGGEEPARRSRAPDAHPASCMIAFSTPAGEGCLQLDGGRGGRWHPPPRGSLLCCHLLLEAVSSLHPLSSPLLPAVILRRLTVPPHLSC